MVTDLSHRFHAEKAYRQARRGSGTVEDGWRFIDTLTGATLRFDVKSEIQGRIESILAREASIAGLDVAAWECDLEHRHRTTNVELRLYGPDGTDHGYFALIERAYAPMRVVEWLHAMGLDDLPRRKR